MALFKDMLHSDESLFKNELALDYSFLPKILPHRENQQRYIATIIKPLLSGKNGKNLFIYGEIELRIIQNLISLSTSDLSKIKNIISHPQAFAQTRKWLKTNLPNAKLINANVGRIDIAIIAKKSSVNKMPTIILP